MLNNNIIITIGGGSCQGKSILALNVAHKLNIPLVISTDTVRNQLFIVYPNNPFLTSPTYLLKPSWFNKQKYKVSRILKELIYIYELRGESIIIEGLHLSSDFISFLRTKSNAFTICINNNLSFADRILNKTETRNIFKYFNPNTEETKYGKITESNLHHTELMKYEKRMTQIHNEIINDFKSEKFPIINFYKILDATNKLYRMIEEWLNTIN